MSEYAELAAKYDAAYSQCKRLKAKAEKLTRSLLAELLVHYSLRQVARRIGRSPTYVSMIKRGHVVASMDTFQALVELHQKMESKL